jgi:catechol 2,3-dioxygenase-like lactoylglutathione lyase family enzyme
MAFVNVTSVGHTGITVSDLDRAIEFYRDILGLPVSDKVQASGEFPEKVTGVPGADILLASARK